MKKISFLILLTAICCCSSPKKTCSDVNDICEWRVNSPGNTFIKKDNQITWNGKILYVVLDTWNKKDGWYNYLVLEPGNLQYLAYCIPEKSVAVINGPKFINDTLYIGK